MRISDWSSDVCSSDLVAAIVSEIPADDQIEVRLGCVTFGRDIILGSGLHALKIILEDEVDHAADGVRSVDGRRPAGNQLYPVDESRRNSVQVRHLPRIEKDVAASIRSEEHTSELQSLM